MKREDLNKELGLLMVVDGERMIGMSLIWRELAQQQLKLLESIEIFLRWYNDDSNEKCPYSRESLKKLADDIVRYFSSASDDFIKSHRNDYDVLEIVCRRQQICSLCIVEIVKLMDYFSEH